MSTKTNPHTVFNPRQHPTDVETAFTKFIRKFGYIYDGENRPCPSTVEGGDAITAWTQKDKAKMFLSRAVSDEFLDDYEAAIPAAERTGIKFNDLVTKMKAWYAPTSNKASLFTMMVP